MQYITSICSDSVRLPHFPFQAASRDGFCYSPSLPIWNESRWRAISNICLSCEHTVLFLRWGASSCCIRGTCQIVAHYCKFISYPCHSSLSLHFTHQLLPLLYIGKIQSRLLKLCCHWCLFSWQFDRHRHSTVLGLSRYHYQWRDSTSTLQTQEDTSWDRCYIHK